MMGLNGYQKSGPDQQRELFDKFRTLANGFSTEDVIGAALNIMVNGLLQAHATVPMALDSCDAMAAKMKALLLVHYDAVTQRRRSTVPFDQVIHVPLFTDPNGL